MVRKLETEIQRLTNASAVADAAILYKVRLSLKYD